MLSIIIVPHDKGHSRTVRVSHRRLRILAVAGVALVAAVGIALVHYVMLLKRTAEMDGMAAENRDLREKVTAIEALNHRLDAYESYVRRIDIALGLGDAGFDPPLLEASSGEMMPGKRAPAEVEIDEAPLLFLSGGSETPSEWPLTRRGFVSRGFGVETAGHHGIDIAVPENTPVRATASGIVCDLGWDDVYGNYVELRHGDGYSTRYCHARRLLVREGQWVRKGEIIAFSGNTGRSTAPHLHYEVRLRGAAVDPYPYLLGYRAEEHGEG